MILHVKRSLGVIGLMFARKCDTPIIFKGTRSIHTIFMNFPIDILFVKNGVVIDKCENLPTWGGYKSKKTDIDFVVEHMAGKFKGINIGDKIDIEY